MEIFLTFDPIYSVPETYVKTHKYRYKNVFNTALFRKQNKSPGPTKEKRTNNE